MLDQVLTEHTGQLIKGGGLFSFLIAIAWIIASAWTNGRRASSDKHAPRDHNHDETLGTLRNVQTSVEALGRRVDGMASRMEQMHAGLDRDMDAMKTDIREVLVYSRSNGSRVVHHSEKDADMTHGLHWRTSCIINRITGGRAGQPLCARVYDAPDSRFRRAFLNCMDVVFSERDHCMRVYAKWRIEIVG